MLLTITTTHSPATELGFLLHKNPTRVQTFDLAFGRAHVCYPIATAEKCRAALLLDVDAVGLIRRGRRAALAGIDAYVNDRRYAASSFLSVAIAQVFGTALGGRSRERQPLADTAIPLEATIAALPCRGGEALLRDLFEPLGYEVSTDNALLDDQFPEWGESRYRRVTLRRTCRLSELLTHLYVLIPVLDDEKHYWAGKDELEKLLRFGEAWLAGHPKRELIAHRYLRHNRHLTRAALARLTEDEAADPDAEEQSHDLEEQAAERELTGAAETAAQAEAGASGTIDVALRVPLNKLRLEAVRDAIVASGARRVLDLGCGEGRLLRLLLSEKSFEEIVGVDVSHRALEIAAKRLRLDSLHERVRRRIVLRLGSLVYRDRKLEGFDAAAVVEVIEHLDPPRLAAFERVLFEFARPRTIIITTPNREYNVMWPTLPAGQFRHRDHRFEWTRGEFRAWAEPVAQRFGYSVRFVPIGDENPEAGAPTQMAIFSLERI